MNSKSVRKFPLYDWWFIPQTAGMTDTRAIVKTLLETRNLTEHSGGYHSPSLMSGMDSAVERISRALKNNEKICVHGDYDVDGIVGAVLMFRFLKSAGGNPSIYLPTRRDQGYGLARDAVEKAVQKGISLIITVDCGIADPNNVQFGNGQNIDFVITDHHSIPENLPDAVSVVHPALPDCSYPYKTLSGAAVAFKLIQALSENLNCPIKTEEFIALVGLSTITDIMPLTGENRLFVRDALKAIHAGHAPHLELLAKFASYKLEQIGPRELGIHIGSRLNAPGRLESPKLSAQFLMESNPVRMTKLAEDIERMNIKRREIQQKLAKKAIEKARFDSDKPVHVLYDPKWHEGLLGVAASAVVQETGKPSILLTKGADGLLKGSGRTADGFNLYAAVKEFDNLLVHFGGHEAACGLTIEESNLDEFRTRLAESIHAAFPDGIPSQQLDITAKLHATDFNFDFTNDLKVLEPYGKDNPEPLFEIGPVAIETANLVGGGNHMKVAFKCLEKKHSGIFFNAGKIRIGDIIGRKVTLAASPCLNEYNGRRSIEFMIKDIDPNL